MSADEDTPQDPGRTEILEEEEFKLRGMFDDVDGDKDGKITMEEFAIACRGLGANPTNAETEENFNEMDENGDGLVPYENFKQFYVKNPQKFMDEEMKQELEEAFERFDRDKDGFITPAEIRTALREIGDTLSDEELDELFSMVDLNGDGKLSTAELVRSMMM